jgi:uncharacterized RDD family membrane protein YckC
MRIWLIINGEKQGPYPIHDIVSRIYRRELDASVHAWHEGMSEWKPLGEIDSFRHEFEATKEFGQSPPPLPQSLHQEPTHGLPTLLPGALWRRWTARMLDMILWHSFSCGFCALVGWPLKEWLLSDLFLVVAMPLWIPLEGLMLHFLGYTPGKLLLGLRVTTSDNARLTLAAAMIRSMRCFFMGMAAFYPLLMPFCHAFSWWFARRQGMAIWDSPQKHQVPARSFPWWRCMLMTMLGLFLSNILSLPSYTVMKEVLSIRVPNHPLLQYMEP